MATNDSHREFCRRRHKALAAYLAILCWRRGADLVAVKRKFLETYLGITKFEGTRIRWLLEDFKPLFPHYMQAFSRASKFASIYFSRVELAEGFPKERMSDEDRVDKLTVAGIPATLIEKEHFSEEQILRELALLAAGLSTPVAT